MSKLNYKKVFTVLFLLVFSVCAFAQTPQYYNYNTGTTQNSFPFSVTGGKAVNTLILAGELSQPTPLPAGQRITAVYFRTGGTGTRAFTNLHILLKQDTIVALTNGTFYPGPMDTVFAKDTSLSSTAGGWMKVTLTTKFNYDPTKSLIMFVGQCGYSGTGTTVYNTPNTPAVRRVWSVGGCPFVPYASVDGGTVNFGVDVEPAAPVVMWPEVLYYKFRNNPTATSVINYAVPGQGTNPAIVTGLPLTSGGQFDSCLSGTGGTGSSAFINTGWSWNLTGNWTIGFWISNLLETSSGSPTYLFGDAGTGSLRCFYGGAALPNNTIFRGPFSATGYTVSTPMPGSYYIHYVWNGSAIKIYKNGVLVSTNPTTNTMPTGTGFKVGGYSTSSYSLNGKMDEFRLYNRALDSAEIASTWNQNIGVITGITPKYTNIPDKYSLSQNYPNPFNPVTKINFALPKSGLVTLKVYDMLGREVATLVNEVKAAGNFTVDFNASNFSSGTYFYRLESNGFIDTKKMMVIK